MKYPNFNEEKKLWKQGYKVVIGVDEAGRGPLAGPVVAAAIVVQKMQGKIPKVNDSKKLTEKQREKTYEFFKNYSSVKWGIGIVSEKIIDKINILQATKLAMKNAIKDLEKKSTDRYCHKIGGRPFFDNTCFLILDGNFTIDYKIKQKSIIKADQKVFSCALASIFAKVTRDRIMEKYHKKYPQYGFNKHKGYGAPYHLKMLKKYGLCKIHRKSFYPVGLASRGRLSLPQNQKKPS